MVLTFFFFFGWNPCEKFSVWFIRKRILIEIDFFLNLFFLHLNFSAWIILFPRKDLKQKISKLNRNLLEAKLNDFKTATIVTSKFIFVTFVIRYKAHITNLEISKEQHSDCFSIEWPKKEAQLLFTTEHK